MDTETNNPKLIWRLRVPSKSHPDTFHIVEIYESGDMRCDCKYNEFGKICSHIKGTHLFLKKLLAKIDQNYGERIQTKQ